MWDWGVEMNCIYNWECMEIWRSFSSAYFHELVRFLFNRNMKPVDKFAINCKIGAVLLSRSI